jgi:hypothetical protein
MPPFVRHPRMMKLGSFVLFLNSQSRLGGTTRNDFLRNIDSE